MTTNQISSSNLHVIHGDLLNSGEPVIVQQINCLCVRPHGLSEQIANKFPYANVYAQRRPQGKRNLSIPEDQGTPGQITVSTAPPNQEKNQPKNNTEYQPIFIGFYGQYDYGKPGGCEVANATERTRSSARRTKIDQDNYQLRQKWFQESLQHLKNYLIENKIPSVGIPYQIGCGLAGGDWKIYQQFLEDFAKDAPFQVNLYKYTPPTQSYKSNNHSSKFSYPAK